MLIFHQGKIFIGSVRLEILVLDESENSGTTEIQGSLVLGSTRLPPADLEFIVETVALVDHTQLQFLLRYQDEATIQRFAGPVIEGTPRDLMEAIVSEIRDSNDASTRLSQIGQKLYRQLFSKEMQREYRRLSKKVESIHIITDDPYIPWELLKPYDDSDLSQIIDDDFLSRKFQLTRWHLGPQGPVGNSTIDNFASAGIATSADELAFFEQLVDEFEIANCSPNPSDQSNVLKKICANETALWHFASESPSDKTQIALQNETVLLPLDFEGAVGTSVRRTRPLIFYSERNPKDDPQLSHLGQWASTLVATHGCGMFVGPVWSVPEQVNQSFFRAYVERLREGRTAGQSAQIARQELTDSAADVLAYRVYAHPNSRIRFGNHFPLEDRVAAALGGSNVDKFESDEYVFAYDEARWVIKFQGTVLFLEHKLGMSYIEKLLSNPGKSFEPNDLYNEFRGGVKQIRKAVKSDSLPKTVSRDRAAEEEVIDDTGREYLQRQLEQMETDIVYATRNGDGELLAKLKSDQKKLIAYLAKNKTPLGPRRTGKTRSQKECNRIYERIRAVRLVLQGKKNSKAFTTYLEKHIKCNTSEGCVYDRNQKWRTQRKPTQGCDPRYARALDF